jgi:hypothetical protein
MAQHAADILAWKSLSQQEKAIYNLKQWFLICIICVM